MSADAARGEGAKILVVDDVALNVKLLADLLGAKGYRTCTAASGAEALAALDREQPDLVRRGAAKIDKILRGERAGDVPIERPAKFRFIVNQKTARAIGVTLPKSLLQRADEVIA